MTTPDRNRAPDRGPAPDRARAPGADARVRPPGEPDQSRKLQDQVDAESEQSFPASDPPSWTFGLH